MGEEDKRTRPPELQGESNWLAWKLKARLILENRGWWKVVEDPDQESKIDNSDEKKRWEKTKMDACEFLYGTLSSDVMRMLETEGAFKVKPVSPAKIWNTLCVHFDAAVHTQKGFYSKLFNDMKLGQGEDAAKWVDRLSTLAEEIRSRGGVISFEQFKSKVLDSLPDDWDSAIMGLSAVENFIQNEEQFKMFFKNIAYNVQRKHMSDVPSVPSVFARLSHTPFASNTSLSPAGRSISRGNAGEATGVRWQGNFKQSAGRFKGACHYCGKIGHKAAQFRKKRRDEHQKASQVNAKTAQGPPSQSSDQPNVTPHVPGGSNIVYSTPIIYPDDHTMVSRAQTARVCNVNVQEGANSWMLDSGASRHFTGKFELLENPKKLTAPLKVKTALGVISATWSGDAFIPLSHNQLFHLKNVLYASKMSENLISSDSLQDDGVEVTFFRAPAKACRLRTPNCDIYLRNSGGVYFMEPYGSRAHVENNAMPMEVEEDETLPQNEEENDEEEADLDEEQEEGDENGDSGKDGEPLKRIKVGMKYRDSAQYWHRRCGHASIEKLRKVEEVGSKFSVDEVRNACDCIACATGKTTRITHPPVKKPSRLNQLIHMDFCGPFRTSGYAGEKLFALFIDDYSCYTTVYPVHRRTQIYALIDAHIRNVNAETNCPVSAIRVDNAPEFCSNTFLTTLNNLNVVPEMVPAYASNYNGKAERANRTILNIARCMLIDSGLPLRFWTYAVTHAAMIHNMLPSTVLNGKSPDEVWSGGRLQWKNVHIFGEKVVCWVSPKKNSDPKLCPRGFVGIYLGGEPFKGYLIYNPQIRTVSWESDIHYYKNGSETGRDMFTQNPNNNPMLEIVSPTDTDEELPIVTAVQAFDVKNINVEEPASWKEAEKSPQAQEWRKAVFDEFQAHRTLGTFEIVDHVEGANKILHTKLIFKVKKHTDGTIDKFKARWFVCGCGQRPGLDFSESSSSVLGKTPLRVLFVIAVARKMVIDQFDAVTAYLNSPIDRDIYVYAPEGSDFPEGTILKLRKAVYGLRQAGRLWQKTISKHLIEMGWNQFHVDDNIFRKHDNFMSVYVDDFVSFSVNQNGSDSAFDEISSKFKLKRMGPIKELLGMNFDYQRDGMYIDQEGYIEKIAKKYSLTKFPKQPLPIDSYNKLWENSPNLNSEDTTVYRGLTGELQYVSGCTRPDLTFAANFLGRSQTNPTQQDLFFAYYVMGFLYRTRKSRLTVFPCHEMNLAVYVDSNLGGEGRHGASSTGGCIIFLANVPVFWKSNVQGRTATLTCEAELSAMHTASETLEVILDLCVDAGVEVKLPTPVYCDSWSAVQIARSGVFGPTMSKRKREMQSVHELYKNGILEPIYIQGCEQRADIFTKALNAARHQELAKLCGVDLVYD